MRNVTIKGLLAHKLRLALTSLAIVLGVTFISGSFVLTDTLHSLFDGLVGNVYHKIDFEVRGVAQFPTSDAASAVRNPLPETLLGTVRGVPGVEGAFGEVSGYAQFVSHQGTPITNGGSPTLGLDFDTDQQISELRLIQGKPPTGPDDVVMDAGTANKYHFAVGQKVQVLSAVAAPRTFTISGIARFGNVNNLAGVTFAAWALPTAQSELGDVGQLDDINVVTMPGADKAEVQAAIARVLPKGTEVVTGQTVVNEQESSINQALSFFGSVWYYPNAKGTYNNLTTASISPTSYNLAYNVLKYQVGLDWGIGKSPVFIDLGWMGDNWSNKTNAPINRSYNGPFAGLGFRILYP